jgi:hypothetical protein
LHADVIAKRPRHTGLYIASTAEVFLDSFTQMNVKNNKASNGGPNIYGPYKTF